MSTAAKPNLPASLNSLPVWAMNAGRTLDVVRAVVRARDDLRVLGTRFGPLKLYSAGEWALIEAALTERDKRREKATAKRG